jgi:hypothetical protein
MMFKPILVTYSDSVKNDLDALDTKKLPNPELIFQIWKDWTGDSIADTHFII